MLDSSFLIDLEQQVPQALQALQTLQSVTQDPLVVPAHAALEFMAGRDPMGAFAALDQSYVVRLPTQETLVACALLRSRKGKPRPNWGDIYIAAEAHLLGTYVITANGKDFEALGSRVWDYRRGGPPPL